MDGPISVQAELSAWRSGRRSASIGVGTVTMKTLAPARSAARLVSLSPELLELALRHFAGAVLAGAKLGDAPLGHIEAPDRRELARKRQRHRKSDIP